jgi:hypothetical protein
MALLTYYPVLSLCVLSATGIAIVVTLVFGHWWLGILFYAFTMICLISLVTWLVRRSAHEE